MMTLRNIEQSFSESVFKNIKVKSEGINRFRVLTPFTFDDGDHIVIVMKMMNDRIVLSDEGHTYMHLTYSMSEHDFMAGYRHTIISKTLSTFGVQDIDGELLLEVPSHQYGDALYSFVQAILKISNVLFLKREHIRSVFLEKFKAILSKTIDRQRLTFDWSDPERDPQNKYVIDCRVNGLAQPLYICGLTSDNKTRDAMITLLQFEKWGVSGKSMAIFEDQEKISRNVLARFTDICDNQFPCLAPNEDRIKKYLIENTSI